MVISNNIDNINKTSEVDAYDMNRYNGNFQEDGSIHPFKSATALCSSFAYFLDRLVIILFHNASISISFPFRFAGHVHCYHTPSF